MLFAYLVIISCNSIKISSEKDKTHVYKELITNFEQGNPFKDSYNVTRTIEVYEANDTINNRKSIEFLEWQNPIVVLPPDDFEKNFSVYNNRIYFWSDKDNSSSASKFYNLLVTYGVALDSCARYSQIKTVYCNDMVEVHAPIKLQEYEIIDKNGYSVYRNK